MRKLFVLMLSLFSCIVYAADNLPSVYLSKPDGLYDIGDTVRVYFRPSSSAPETLVYQKIYTEPTAVVLHREDLSFDGAIDGFQRIGFVVGAEQFRPGFTAPADLQDFWKTQVARLGEIPMNVILTPVPLNGEDALNYECFALEIQMLDTVSVHGYIARPKNAAEHTLPVLIQAHAAGVAGHWCRSSASTALWCAKQGSGAIGIDINAHGMLDGQSEEYYQQLENGALKDYSYRRPEDTETYYFRRMFLRMERTIEYVTRDPLWDGKRIMILGQSQGGAQAAALAGIDSRVSAIATILPAMHDLGASLRGRQNAWPLRWFDVSEDPVRTVAPYFDCALLLALTSADLCVEIGLCDSTCPPAGIFAALNNARGAKSKVIVTCPYREHEDVLPYYQEYWKSEVESVRNSFIAEHLK